MPLPSRDMQWPPKSLGTILPKINEWAAWYSGDPEALSAAYGSGFTGTRPLAHVRPSQFSGGVAGRLARWFWGQPTSDQQQRTKLHVPIAADIATTSADQLFAEPPRIVTDKAEKAKRERLDTILEGIRWESLLPEAGEAASAMTGTYLRVVWDDEIAQQPLLDAVDQDMAWPEFRFGRLVAVTFWQVVAREGSTTWRHLERHVSGRIEHGLYKGTESLLGQRVPLEEQPATAALAKWVDEQSGIETGTQRLTAVYIPNVLPQRGKWRHDPIGCNLGRSDLDGIEPEMDALDETFTSWMRDVRVAKARLLVDQSVLETKGRGQGAEFDMDREVFVPLNLMGGDEDSTPITAQQFTIRAADHQATIEWTMRQIVSSAGYSAGTFGLDAEGAAMTATEVGARERKSSTTREKKTRYWTPELAAILQAVMDVDRAKFGGPGPFESLTIEFPASVQPTIVELATTAQLLKVAQAASTETLVKLVHPDWQPDDVRAEVDRIIAENAISVPEIPLPGDYGDEPVEPASGE